MNTISEKDDLFLNLTFTDNDGLAVIPTSLVYRIDDVMSGEKVRDNTTVYPTSALHTIAISSAENSIFNEELGSEERRVTMTFYYLDGDDVVRRKNTEYFYTVMNLHMLETPALVVNGGTHALSNDSITL